VENGGNSYQKYSTILSSNQYTRFCKKIDKMNFNFKNIKLTKQYTSKKVKDHHLLITQLILSWNWLIVNNTSPIKIIGRKKWSAIKEINSVINSFTLWKSFQTNVKKRYKNKFRGKVNLRVNFKVN